MKNSDLHPYQQKMLDDLRSLSKEVIFFWPNRMGKATYQKHVARNNIRTNAYYSMYGRQHKKKRWMSDTYHRRIQKKWDKRYGKGTLNAKQPVADSIRKLLTTPAESRVMRPDYGSDLANYHIQGQEHGRILRERLQEPIVLMPLSEKPEGAFLNIKVLKERKCPEAKEYTCNFTVNSTDIKDDAND